MKRSVRYVAWPLLLLLALACQKKDRASATGAPPASAAAALEASTSAVAATKASHRPSGNAWAGTWAGTYDARHYPVEAKTKEALPAWDKDPKTEGMGKGKLQITVAEDSRVAGTSSGPLGDLIVNGKVEDGSLRATVAPRDPDVGAAFHGYLVAESKQGTKLAGRMQVSSGDSAWVREAPVELVLRR
ncbi:hypothetical protein ACFL5O_06620 [Myxococcota bacterium]